MQLHDTFRTDGPIYAINAWYQDGQPFRSLVMTGDLRICHVAWDMLQDKHPNYELTMQQGARVMRRREPLEVYLKR